MQVNFKKMLNPSSKEKDVPTSKSSVKDLRTNSMGSRKSATDTASTKSTSNSSFAAGSGANNIAATAEQKQKIAAATKTHEKERRASAGSNASLAETANKNLPREIEVSTTLRSKLDHSFKTNLTDDDASKTSTSAQLKAEHYVREQYGISELPTEDKSIPTEEVELRFASALCFAIGRDYSAEQQEWLLGDLSAKGYSQSVLDKVPELLKQSSKLMDMEVALESKKVITGDLKKDAAMLVYDMYRCSIINDFPSEQVRPHNMNGVKAKQNESFLLTRYYRSRKSPLPWSPKKLVWASVES